MQHLLQVWRDEFGGKTGIDHKVVGAGVLYVELDDDVFTPHAAFGKSQSNV